MDNKKPQQQPNFSSSRQANPKACQSAESSQRKSTELQSKPWPKSSRRSEHPSAYKNDQQRNSKPQQQPSAKTRPYADKRPRARTGYNNSNEGEDYDNAATAADGTAATTRAGLAAARGSSSQKQLEHELNSVYLPGNKKQNLNHLLNFHYAAREADYAAGMNVFGRGGGSGGAGAAFNRSAGKKHKYNKEQFMQANFQFVIKSCAKPKHNASPDALIDWQLIEQINIQTTEEPQCPICLFPPIAAKLTRCGHAYCWPCILHYLALTDKSWRKCPICYEAIHIADLKSTTIVEQLPVKVGYEITFHLMRRRKGSMFIEKYQMAAADTIERYPQYAGHDEAKLFSKFLIAKRADILSIIERERGELLADVDVSCPEYCFIQQALDLLKERREQLGDVDIKEEQEQPFEVTKKLEKNKDLLEQKNVEQINENKYQHNMALAEIKEEFDLDKNLEKQREDVEKNMQKIEELNVEKIPDFTVGLDVNNLEKNEVADLLNNVKIELDINDASLVDVGAQNVETIMEDNLLQSTGTYSTTKYYYFYQSVDGQNIYLHPLNVKMLQACYGTLEQAPLIINARILQKEHHSMDEQHRRKFTCLGHLPLTCQFDVVEVDLQPPVINDTIYKMFKDDILFRRKERQRRDREERKREKQIDEINDRQMGKLIASTANINLGSSHEFPTCGFEESLVSSNASGSSNLNSTSKRAAEPKRATTVAHQNASYSAMAVVGEAPHVNYWPTLATPAATTSSYNSYQELSSWGRSAAATTARPSINSQRSSECDSLSDANADYYMDEAASVVESKPTNLGDVLAEALSQKKNKKSTAAATTTGNKKKSKKMQPLFTTGMNFNGN